MLNSKIRPRAVVGYGVKIFLPSPLNYVTRSPGTKAPTILLLGGGGGGWVILEKIILQVNMRKKKIPAQDHRPKTNSRTFSGLEKDILARCSLC